MCRVFFLIPDLHPVLTPLFIIQEVHDAKPRGDVKLESYPVWCSCLNNSKQRHLIPTALVAYYYYY
jgi:hypothetical protein